ncbi:hypothetical protein DM01DRAFT_1340133 [Hesseltinella vesiculosa]|uniref:Uncharacterized protein n=1 Tax=Hesseltinella vesiculosa TaxID=101127 RepID=A0A1X2G587_9FUNG|nr:hypothetical protein DM01DRAFT_1340133 [Hesseltinella vesiculosa]
MSWEMSLDSQRGAVVDNNAAKLARWALQALLAGATQLNWVTLPVPIPRTTAATSSSVPKPTNPKTLPHK